MPRMTPSHPADSHPQAPQGPVPLDRLQRIRAACGCIPARRREEGRNRKPIAPDQHESYLGRDSGSPDVWIRLRTCRTDASTSGHDESRIHRRPMKTKSAPCGSSSRHRRTASLSLRRIRLRSGAVPARRPAAYPTRAGSSCPSSLRDSRYSAALRLETERPSRSTCSNNLRPFMRPGIGPRGGSSDRETFPSLEAPRLEDGTAPRCPHASTKSVHTLTPTSLRLICAFHRSHPLHQNTQIIGTSHPPVKGKCVPPPTSVLLARCHAVLSESPGAGSGPSTETFLGAAAVPAFHPGRGHGYLQPEGLDPFSPSLSACEPKEAPTPSTMERVAVRARSISSYAA